MRDRPHVKAVKLLLRQYQKRVLRCVRLIRKWNPRKGVECICLLLVVLSVFVRFFFISPARSGISRDEAADGLQIFRSNSYHADDSEFRLRREAELGKENICSRTKIHDHVEEFRLCGDFPANNRGKKIVGLVEVRNVERTISTFLSALGRTVDSVVLIDDHSTDMSRNAILEFDAVAQRAGAQRKVVEVLLNKSGNWVRDELLDHQLLLEAARDVGGSHFVVLDYDEYLSANCVENGLLRHSILSLRPGESLYLPWVEMWKSPALQRVLPRDREMNFLRRRQIAIFADDKAFHYTEQNSAARQIGQNVTSHNGTIHVVRCPRTICPQPARYRGPGSHRPYPSKVKHLSHCAILEVRFLSLNNILLKSAWYEALGRVMGSKDGVTSGKMVRVLFPRREVKTSGSDDEYRDDVALSVIPPNLMYEHADFNLDLYNQVETWRGEELLQWMEKEGTAHFHGLEAVSLIDERGLRSALQRSKQNRRNVLYHVPRIKTGSLVMAIETSSMKAVSALLKHLNWSEMQVTEAMRSSAVRLSQPMKNLQQYEGWKTGIERAIHRSLALSRTKEAFFSCAGENDEFQIALLEVLRNEFACLRVTVVFAKWTTVLLFGESLLFEKARAYAVEAGSHLRVVDVPVQSFGSYATLMWLRDSLSSASYNLKTRFIEADDEALLALAEKFHENGVDRHLNVPLVPVAKLVFSLNVGRSGSKYFADILRSVNSVISAVHEAACENRMCSGGGAIRMQNLSLAASYESRAAVKLPMIRSALSKSFREQNKKAFLTKSCHLKDVDTLRWSETFSVDTLESFRPVVDVSSTAGCNLHTIRDVVYAETNPNFKSWFYDVVLKTMPKSGYSVTVIVIRKYVAAVLKSLYETGYFTSRDGYNWMETSAGVNSNVKVGLLRKDTNLDAYDRILSYLLASEARFRHILKTYGAQNVKRESSKYPVKFIQTRSEHLYSRNGTLELLRSLNLKPSSSTDNLIGIVADKYRDGSSAAKRRRLRTTLKECEHRTQQFVSRLLAESPEIANLFNAMSRVEGFEYPL